MAKRPTKPSAEIVPTPDASPAFVLSTVTDSDLYTSSYTRVPNSLLGSRLDLASGPAAVWAKLNATACAAVRVRLYRSGGEGKPVEKARRMYLESGRAGEKAAKWASDSDDLVEVEDHPVLLALNTPNAWDSGHEFAWRRYWFREACGNAFVYVETQGPRPTLYLLNPRYVQIVASREDLIGTYRYGREDSIVRNYEPDVICHYRLFGGEDPYYGSTWVSDVASAIQVLKANYAHQENFIKGGMLPPFALKIEGAATPEQIEEIRREVRRHNSGLKRWNEPLIMRGADIVQMPAKPNEYQTKDQLESFRRDIRNAAGVPESMADVNEANLASATVGYDKQYLGVTIAPRVQKMCADDTVYLLPKFGVSPGEMFFAMDEIVEADDEAMLQRHTVAVGRWMSPDEARAEWGMEAGYTQTTGTPQGDTGEPMEADPAEPVEPAADPVAPDAAPAPAAGAEPLPQALNGAQVTAALEVVTRVAAGDIPRDAGVAMLREFFGLAPERAEAIMGQAGTGTATTPNVNPAAEVPTEPVPGVPGVPPEPMAEEVAKSFARWYPVCGHAHKAITAVNLPPKSEVAASQLEAAVREWMTTYGGQAVVAGNGAVIMSAEATSALDAILRTGLLKVMEAGVASMGDQPPDNFQLKVPDSYVVWLASTIKESTQDALTSAIRTGVEEGATVQQLQERVANAASEISGDAAYRIARTEGAYAQEEAVYQLNVANGATAHKWGLAAGGCPVCAEFASVYGGEKPISEPYAVAGTTFSYVDESGATRTFEVWRDAFHPPLHPHCRCFDSTVEVKRALDQ